MHLFTGKPKITTVPKETVSSEENLLVITGESEMQNGSVLFHHSFKQFCWAFQAAATGAQTGRHISGWDKRPAPKCTHNKASSAEPQADREDHPNRHIPSVTLLLLQPGSLTHLMPFLLLACDSIWSSHTSVEGLNPWLWPRGYTMDQNMKRMKSISCPWDPPWAGPCLHSGCQSPRSCVPVWFAGADCDAVPPKQPAGPSLPLSCFSWGGHFQPAVGARSEQCSEHLRQAFQQNPSKQEFDLVKCLSKNTC